MAISYLLQAPELHRILLISLVTNVDKKMNLTISKGQTCNTNFYLGWLAKGNQTVLSIKKNWKTWNPTDPPPENMTVPVMFY
jgi:hypothetical protein